MNDVVETLQNTFFVDNKYLIFLEGFVNTLILTFVSLILGILLGLLFTRMIYSKNKKISKLGWAITTLFVEMPTVVLLMIIVYIIFSHISFPVLIAAIIALTLKAAAYHEGIFEAVYKVVDKGEIEAARSLGMTKWQTFKKITFPQAFEAAAPLLKSQFVSTMQETSIVGYLAIMDMTMAITTLTDRIVDSFLGYLVITVVYMLISALVKHIINRLLIRVKEHII